MKKYTDEELKVLFTIDFSKLNWKDLKYKSPRKISLLIVDDERSFRELLEEIFESQGGYEVDIAANGEIGLEKFKLKKHEIVLSDIMMDSLTGIEMAKDMLLINPEQKIFFFSGWFSEHQLVEKFEAQFETGNFQFVDKPFDIEEFQNKIYLFENTVLSKIKLYMLNQNQLDEVLQILTPYQLLGVHQAIWNLAITLFKKLLGENLKDDELSALMPSISDYMRSVGCTYDLEYCLDNSCILTSPNCVRKKLQAQIEVMVSILNRIYDHYQLNNS